MKHYNIGNDHVCTLIDNRFVNIRFWRWSETYPPEFYRSKYNKNEFWMGVGHYNLIVTLHV